MYPNQLTKDAGLQKSAFLLQVKSVCDVIDGRNSCFMGCRLSQLENNWELPLSKSIIIIIKAKTDLIITKADKSNTLVILNKEAYNNEGLGEIQDGIQMSRK